MLNRLSTVILMAAATAAGAAHAQERHGRGPEILPQLPADAPPGECFARVRVPGEPIAQPPLAPGAHWVLSPGPAGSPGPIWCLIPNGPPIARPMLQGPDSFGWIRVLCDADATADRIRGVQHRLHDRGYYRGEMNGRYDADTAAAVGRFQSESHIDHGGYLSLDTLDALEGQGGYARPQYRPGPDQDAPRRAEAPRHEDLRRDERRDDQGRYGERRYEERRRDASRNEERVEDDRGDYYSAYSRQSSSQYSSSGDWEYGFGAPQPPVYGPPSRPSAYGPAPGPCCTGQGGYGYGDAYHPIPPYAAGPSRGAGSAVRNGWLVWNGKTEF